MMGIPRRALATVMVSLLVATPVYAQAPTAQQKQEAGDLTKQAIAKSQAGEHEMAVELYLKAYDIIPLPVLLSNVGAEYQKMGKPVEALKYFCKYLDEDPTGSSATFARAQAKLIHIEQGNKDVTDETVCAPPKPAQQPQPVVEQSPAVEPAPAPTASSNDRGKGLRIAGLGVGVAGLAAMGVGIYFGLEAKKISDQISDHDRMMMWPDNIQDLEEEGQAHENKQIALMIAGGALIATGVALYFIGRSRKSSEVTVTPTATPDGGAVFVTGGF